MNKKRILLVEDDPDVWKAVAYCLRKHNYEVLLANDGPTAVQLAQSVPHLVILDLQLPGLSGEEVCKTIREDTSEEIQKIPIIMLTAKTRISDRIVGKVIGANLYMTKPFHMKELTEEIERLITVPKEAA